MTNIIVTAMLVLGGAAVIHSLTGVNIYLGSFLIPIGVIVYTFFGGLKATSSQNISMRRSFLELFLSSSQQSIF